MEKPTEKATEPTEKATDALSRMKRIKARLLESRSQDCEEMCAEECAHITDPSERHACEIECILENCGNGG